MTATATTLQAPPDLPPAHRDPNVLRWLGAFVASLLGDNVYFLTLSWAATRAGSPAQAGLVLAAASVPRAVLMLGGGVVADRFGPRKVVIGSDLMRCVVILAVAGVLAVAHPRVWLLMVVGLVFGTVDALFLPAVGALPARITTLDQLARVQGLRGLASRVATIGGSLLGGLAMALGGSPVAFAVAGTLFAVSLPLLITVRMVPLPDHHRAAAASTPWQDLAAGLRHIRRNRVLALLVLVLTISEMGFTGPLNIGVTLLTGERGWGAAGLGWIVGGFGGGAATAALVLAVRGRIPHAGLVQQGCLALSATALAALAFVPSLAVAVGVAIGIGLTAGLNSALGSALLQTAADPAYFGRITAVSSLFSLGIGPLTYPLTGAAIAAWGTRPVFTASAAIVALGSGIGLCAPSLRHAELPC
ncbi:MFS transporter [Streptomyces rubrisoli]|uniref:MFS transporter n=1 Tax=Streptantibioticus rubrisoli TaxID=1387313 RepID=A0ABT1PEB6_9ACTN|nr:MFS transporter [Streptantibioticus rubrisoli]MCQ4043699.1 MFS transporter [Streptantibioticus rubrisoli]